jgi:hypothetical protein
MDLSLPSFSHGLFTRDDAQPDADTKLPPVRWVVLTSYLDPWQARLAAGELEAAGIESRLADEHLVDANWFLANAVGGVKLLVKAEEKLQAAAALGLLDDAPGDPGQTAEDSPEMASEDDAPCRRCGGLQAEPKKTSLAWALVGLLLFGIPLLLRRKSRPKA